MQKRSRKRVPKGSQKGVKTCKKSVSKAFPEGFPFLGEKSMIFEPLQTRWEGFSLESQHVFHIFACIPEGTKNEAQNLPKLRPEALEKLFREGLKNMCFFNLFFETVLLPIGLQNGAPSRPQNEEIRSRKQHPLQDLPRTPQEAHFGGV